jgi:hypothetical protein
MHTWQMEDLHEEPHSCALLCLHDELVLRSCAHAKHRQSTLPAGPCRALLCCAAVEWGQEVALVGGVDTLGAWDVEKSIPMLWNDGDMWTAEAELPTE